MADPELLDVAIVGAGISGIGMAAYLGKHCPGHRYAVLERRARLGGTWDLFRYPGIRSDSDMHTLGFKFAPWTASANLADGPAIRDYLETVAADHGIAPHIRYNTSVVTADWSSAGRCWTLTFADGEPVRARFVVMAAGYYDYDEPFAADIPGLTGFGGEVLHPQFWPEGWDAAGKQVAVIGSGATAVTLAPALARLGARVSMVQRTPSYIFALPNEDPIGKFASRLLPARAAFTLTRGFSIAVQDFMFSYSRRRPRKMAAFLKRAAAKAVGPAYAPRDFSPPYNPWEQRLCLVPDGDLFKAVASGGVQMVTGEIAMMGPRSITMADGTEVPADAIVTATGLAIAVCGKVRVSMDGIPVEVAQHHWYRSAMFSGIPNFAGLFGYLNASWTLRIDLVADYLARLLAQMAAWQRDVVVPVLPAGHGFAAADPFADYSSGYLRRAAPLMPQSLDHPVWRLSMDYRADRRTFAEASIDDGWLEFS